jgi:hypothetical protein
MHDGRIQYISLANASVRIVGQSDRRVRLTIYAPSSGTVTLSGQSPAVPGNGITLSAGQAPLYFDTDFHGECVGEEWYGIKGDNTITTIGFIETICNRPHNDLPRNAGQRRDGHAY